MRNSKPEIKLAVPDGHLQEGTKEIFEEAGFDLKGYDKEERNYRPEHPEIEVKVIRPQEIPHLVERGTYDIGVTGWDWLEETGVLLKKNRAKVQSLLDLEHGSVNLVLAISRKTKGWKTVKDANDLLKRAWNKEYGLTIATEYMQLTQRFISSRSFYKAKKENERIGPPKLVLPWSEERKSETPVRILFSYGTTEGKPPDDADAIVENKSTGQTLDANNLMVIDTVLEESTAWFIANKECLSKKTIRPHICRLARALHGAVLARKFLHLFVNIPDYDQEKLKDSELRKLAQQEITVVKADSGGARIDLLIASKDCDVALDSLHKLRAKDTVVLSPRLAWPSKAIDEKRAPYLKIFKDQECS